MILTYRLQGLVFMLVCSLLTACSGKSLKPETGAKERESTPQSTAVVSTIDPFVARFDKALDYLKAQQQDKAYREFEMLYQEYPDRSEVVVNLVIMDINQSRYDTAEQKIKTYVERYPEHGNKTLLNLDGMILQNKGAFRAAAEAYKRALAMDETYGNALLNLAMIKELYLGELAEALVLYQRYQRANESPDATVANWILDLERRIQ